MATETQQGIPAKITNASASIEGVAQILTDLMGADQHTDRTLFACSDLLSRISDELDGVAHGLEFQTRKAA